MRVFRGAVYELNTRRVINVTISEVNVVERDDEGPVVLTGKRVTPCDSLLSKKWKKIDLISRKK